MHYRNTLHVCNDAGCLYLSVSWWLQWRRHILLIITVNQSTTTAALCLSKDGIIIVVIINVTHWSGSWLLRHASGVRFICKIIMSAGSFRTCTTCSVRIWQTCAQSVKSSRHQEQFLWQYTSQIGKPDLPTNILAQLHQHSPVHSWIEITYL